MKYYLFTIITVIVTSCITQKPHKPRPNPYALIGTYQEGRYEAVTKKNFNDVWDNIIELFATRGIHISIIDKSSGLIMSNGNDLRGAYTYEDDSGRLGNPDAFVVIKMRKDVLFKGYAEPYSATCDWNIRVKQLDSGGCMVNVNLVNLNAYYISTSSYGIITGRFNLQIKSTGVFERLIASKIE